MRGGGIIFVSIDDNEQAYLKVLMDEIFGEENFIACIPRRTKISGAIKTSFLQKNHDYVLIYVKNIHSWKGFSKKISEENNYNCTDVKYGSYIPRPLDSNGFMSVQKDKRFIFQYQGEEFYPGGKEEYYKSNAKWFWRWTEKEIKEGLEHDYVFFKKGKKGYKRLYQKFFYSYELDKKTMILHPIKRHKNYSSIDFLNSSFANSSGKKNLEKVLEKNSFSFPKPVELIKNLMKLSPNKEMLVLDFFAGSGTTGQAVLELNEKNDTNHQFILVTNNENQIATKFCYPRLFNLSKKLFLKLQVFEINYHNIDLTKNLNSLENKALQNLKKINPNVNLVLDKICYSLTSLYPEKKEYATY